MQKIKSYLLFFLVLFSLLAGLPFSPFSDNIAVAGSLSGNSSMGYELLDDGAVFHMWNGFDDYYFNTSSGIQVTNHYQEWWTHNVMLLGYYAGSTWNIIYRTDELTGFSWSIDTDDSTYINVTGYRDLTYAGYSFRLAIRYCLNDDSEDLTIIPYIKNLGIPIPYTLGFGWEIKDIKIGNTYENDQIRINSTSYLLNQTLDIMYSNITKRIYNNLSTPPTSEIVPDPIFYLDNLGSKGNINRELYLSWDSSLDYVVQVKSKDGQYNAPVTLFIKVGTLASGQEKYTKLHWWDSDTLFEYYIVNEDGAGGCFGATWDAQTFTIGTVGANQAHRISSVKLKLYRLGSPGTITIQIKAVDPATGKPTGANLTWATTNGNTLSAVAPGGYREINFTVKPSLSASTQYAIIMNVPNGDAGNEVLFMEDSTASAYAGGTVVVSSNSGSTWTVISAYDMMFYEYGTSLLFNITSYPATGIMATNATLRGKVETGNQTAHMQFKYGTTLAYGTYTANQSVAVNTTQNYSQNIGGLTPGKLYHFRASGKNTSKTKVGADKMFLTKPEAPTNLLYTTINSTAINISWTKGTGANRTVIVKKTGAVPTSASDGTEIYNNTGTYYKYTKGSNEFVQMWSFTKWINGTTTLYQYSTNSSLYIVLVNCYNESSGQAISNFSIFFTNPTGTQTYAHDNCNNSFAISVNDIPQGDDISIRVNKTGYYTRTYIQDIVVTGNYYFNAYLVPITATLYYLRVVETIETSYSTYDQAVEDASVIVKRYINASAGYQTISSLISDANGYVNLQLVPYVQYKVFISKTGYDSAVSDYIPAPPNDFGQTVEKVFRIVLTAINITPSPSYLWSDYITFTGTIDNTTKIITTTYNDALTNTTDWQLYVYLIDPNSTALTLVKDFSGTNDSFTLTANITDTTSSYVVIFHVNHTNFGYQRLELYFYGYHHPPTSAAEFNLLFTLNYGYNPFGWANTFMFFVILGCFFSFGRRETYMCVFAIGFILLFVNGYIGIQTIWNVLAAGFFPIILIFFGILMLVRDRGYSGVS